MTEWGMLLLCAFIALGATDRITWRRAGFVGLGLTVVVIGYAVTSYRATTPTDKYIPSIDATIYATGNWARDAKNSTLNFSGVKAANWFTTNHSQGGGG